MKKILIAFVICVLALNANKKSVNFLYAQIDNASLYAKSSIDWTKRTFTSSITLDMQKANLELPTARNSSESLILLKTPFLLKNPLLSLYVDSANYLGDTILEETITLEQITEIIENAKKTPTTFSQDGKNANLQNEINLNRLSEILVRHRYPYTPEEPIETVASKEFTGIIIDARGSFPVHGEFVKSQVYPAFFPTIWDENMQIFYEKNMVKSEIVKKINLVDYNYKDDFELYEDRIGQNPLYIKTYRVYGRNRTDPIIRKKDALKILTVEKNRNLLTEGKVVILLDKENLIHDISIPEKNPEYYATFRKIKKYVYENKVPDIEVKDSLTGILFSVDLKFIPDSPELLPQETPRIQKIADMLSQIIKNNEFTILVEGHTADLGKPIGQMNLSIERTRTVMKALVNEGIPEKIFTYKGYGATRPIAKNDTEEGRAQNRRVDITARPKATYIQRDW